MRLPYPPFDVLVAWAEEEVFAIEDACNHAGASLAEGWLETARLVVVQRRPEGGIREVRAFDGVRLEFSRADERGMPVPVTGTADRLVWDPLASVARLFGDRAPAQVRRAGEKGGTTTGRVLRYRIDAGVVEVESAPERDR